MGAPSKVRKLTAARLRELLFYEPATGVFTWRVGRGNARAGDVAGSPDNRGYRKIKIDGPDYRAHRLAWLYVKGEWPPREIDHVNRVRADSRFMNLRLADAGQQRGGQRVRVQGRLVG